MKVLWLLGALIILLVIGSHGSTVSASVWSNAIMLNLLTDQLILGDAVVIGVLDDPHQATLDSPVPARRNDACTPNALANPSGLAPMVCAVEYAYSPQATRPFVSEEADPLFIFLVAKGDMLRADFVSAVEGLTLLERFYRESHLIKQEKIDALMGITLARIADRDLAAARIYLDEIDRLGNDNVWDWFQVYSAMNVGGFEEIAVEYLARSKYYHLDNRLSDYIHIVVPKLLLHSLVEQRELERLHTCLLWQGRYDDADDLVNAINAVLTTTETYEVFPALHKSGEARHTSDNSSANEVEHARFVVETLQIPIEDVSLGPNKVLNGTFEVWLDVNTPQGWTWTATTSETFDNALVLGGADQGFLYEGEHSVRISRLWQMNISGKAPFRAGFSAQIKPDLNTPYHILSFAYRTDEMNAASAAILFDCFNGVTPGDYLFLPNTQGEWRVGMLIGSLKESCAQQTNLFLANFGVGDVWFDDVSFVPIQTKDSVIEGDLSRPSIQIR